MPTPQQRPRAADTPWRPIESLTEADFLDGGFLASTDALRVEWESVLHRMSEAERVAARRRTLNKLSIETGVIERLYDVEWGLTLNLAAEGLTREVVDRHQGVMDDDTLTTIRAQRDALELVIDFTREERRLTPSFIKSLHEGLTLTQHTYDATDALGRRVRHELPKGEWKRAANGVVRSDGSRLDCCDPNFVEAEMVRLCELYAQLDVRRDVHPIIRCAWLHHRFVQIHPFADGNGRVARALAMLVLLKAHYAPLVVDRFHRDEYLRALDAANDGTLVPLIKLFAKLEGTALTSELERTDDVESGVGQSVARTLAAQLKAYQDRKESAARRQLAPRAIAHFARIKTWFFERRTELLSELAKAGLTKAEVVVLSAGESDATAHYFKQQIIRSAKTAGHFANFSLLRSWAALRVRFAGQELRFVASLHAVGRDAGIAAVTTFAELGDHRAPTLEEDGDGAVATRKDYVQTSADAFRFVHTESAERLLERFGEQAEFLDQGLTVAVGEFLRRF